MIYITGDTHGMQDWEKLNTTNFPDQLYMPLETDKYHGNDYLIILGDFGGIWGDEGHDRHVIKTYNQRRFMTLFIDGNHENHDLLDQYPVEEWNGGKVHCISDKVVHLMRGQVYTIEGIKIFTMGGAESTDKKYRKEGTSWWAREMPSDEEYEEALRNLEKQNFEVDIVLTHCAPEGYIGKNMRPVYNSDMSRILAYSMAGVCDRSGNRLTKFFDDIITVHGLKFKHWYFGHYHRNMDWDRFSLVFNKIIPLGCADLTVWYESRDIYEKSCDEDDCCFKCGDSYLFINEPDEKPGKPDRWKVLNVVASKKDYPEIEKIAEYFFDDVYVTCRTVLMVVSKDGSYSYSCAKAMYDYITEKKKLFFGLVYHIKLMSMTKCAGRELVLNQDIYTAMKTALEKKGQNA